MNENKKAEDYLASALHPLSCRANGFVLSGGVTDHSMCDCGLLAARRLVGRMYLLPTPEESKAMLNAGAYSKASESGWKKLRALRDGL